MQSIKFLTFNMQAGIGTKTYSHYLTKAHRQFLHSKGKAQLLVKIAHLIADYDIVCLQEVDLGGRRSGFKCQLETLVKLTGHHHYIFQENRTVGKTSRHGNATLSRFRIGEHFDLKLPGRFKGRGALISKLRGPTDLFVANLHLSLSTSTQHRQLQHIADNLNTEEPIIVAGDFNTGPDSLVVGSFAKRLKLAAVNTALTPTYPSWKPKHAFDSILVSHERIHGSSQTLQQCLSDHLPLSADLHIEGT